MRRLHTLLLGLTVTSALPAFAEVHLLPESTVAATEGARLGAELVAQRGGQPGVTAMGLGVASLLVGATSLVAGFAASSAGQWELFVPLVVLVPMVTTLLGTVLIVVGAVAGATPNDDAAAHDEVASRRVALLKLRDAERAEGCAEPPAPVVSTTPSAPPLVPTGHVRGPLKPAPAPAP